MKAALFMAFKPLCTHEYQHVVIENLLESSNLLEEFSSQVPWEKIGNGKSVTRVSRLPLPEDPTTLPSSKFEALFDDRLCLDGLRQTVIESLGPDLCRLKALFEHVLQFI